MSSNNLMDKMRGVLGGKGGSGLDMSLDDSKAFSESSETTGVVGDSPSTVNSTEEVSQGNKSVSMESVVQQQPPVTAVSFFGDNVTFKKLSQQSSDVLSLLSSFSGGKISGENTLVMEVPRTSSKPLSVGEIVDEDGNLAKIISSVSDSYQLRILPSSLVRVPVWAKIPGYYTFTYGQEEYFAPEHSGDIIDRVVAEAVEVLRKGKVFTYVAATSDMRRGRRLINFNLSPLEIREVCTLLANYGANCLDKGSNEDERFIIVAGDYML